MQRKKLRTLIIILLVCAINFALPAEKAVITNDSKQQLILSPSEANTLLKKIRSFDNTRLDKGNLYKMGVATNCTIYNILGMPVYHFSAYNPEESIYNINIPFISIFGIYSDNAGVYKFLSEISKKYNFDMKTP